VAKRTDHIEAFQKSLGAVAALIIAISGLALAGHSIGWW
jgi:hypothetical protein